MIEKLGGELEAVYPLLGDSTKVFEMSGCIGTRTTVAQGEMRSLCAAVERAAESDTSWAKKEMTELANRLK